MSSQGVTLTGIVMPSSAPPSGDGGGGASPYDEWIRQAAEQEGIDPVQYRRQAVRESGLNPNAVNPKSGAAGIMQFMGPTARELGIDPFNAKDAIFAGARYMRQLGAQTDYVVDVNGIALRVISSSRDARYQPSQEVLLSFAPADCLLLGS